MRQLSSPCPPAADPTTFRLGFEFRSVEFSFRGVGADRGVETPRSHQGLGSLNGVSSTPASILFTPCSHLQRRVRAFARTPSRQPAWSPNRQHSVARLVQLCGCGPRVQVGLEHHELFRCRTFAKFREALECRQRQSLPRSPSRRLIFESRRVC